VNRSSHQNSSPEQLRSIADVVARLRSRRPKPPRREETEAREGAGDRLGRVSPPARDAVRGTENQRRYWEGGKRQPAKIVLPAEVDLLLQYAENRRYAERNRVIVLLSFKAGMRACEISGLKWEMVVGSDGAVGDQLLLAQGITKGGRGRTIPMHPQLKEGLQLLHKAQGEPISGHVLISERKSRFKTQSVVNWFAVAFRDLGLVGCSSHSGRRTFITTSARVLAKTGGSLRDIQELAGHGSSLVERCLSGPIGPRSANSSRRSSGPTGSA
jgi:integrase/recombinase XerD